MLPTHVGVNRYYREDGLSFGDAPHARGGEPMSRIM